MDVDHTALRRVSVNRVGRGVGDGLGKAALGRAVGASKEKSHVLAMNGERDEAEMMGEEGRIFYCCVGMTTVYFN